MTTIHLCKKEDGGLVNYASPDRITLTDTHDGEVYFLEWYDFSSEEHDDGRPIGWCPWCGINLDTGLKKEEEDA